MNFSDIDIAILSSFLQVQLDRYYSYAFPIPSTGTQIYELTSRFLKVFLFSIQNGKSLVATFTTSANDKDKWQEELAYKNIFLVPMWMP